MDTEVWQKLSDSEKSMWSHLSHVFESAGWKLICQDLDSAREAMTSAMLSATSWQDFVFAKGKLEALTYVRNIDDLFTRQMEQVVTEREFNDASP